MIKCPNCGTLNDASSQFCKECGANLRSAADADTGDVGALGILFFCIPISGAIMYFVWRDDKPYKAKKACNLALWGFGFGIVMNIIVSLFEAL